MIWVRFHASPFWFQDVTPRTSRQELFFKELKTLVDLSWIFGIPTIPSNDNKPLPLINERCVFVCDTHTIITMSAELTLWFEETILNKHTTRCQDLFASNFREPWGTNTKVPQTGWHTKVENGDMLQTKVENREMLTRRVNTQLGMRDEIIQLPMFFWWFYRAAMRKPFANANHPFLFFQFYTILRMLNANAAQCMFIQHLWIRMIIQVRGLRTWVGYSPDINTWGDGPSEYMDFTYGDSLDL